MTQPDALMLVKSLQEKILNVGIDATPMLVERKTGIERYADALVRELSNNATVNNPITPMFYLHAGNPYASKDNLRDAVSLFEARGRKYRVFLARRGYGLALSYYSLRDRLHLLHLLKTAKPQIEICPYILTIYDHKEVGLTQPEQTIERARLNDAEKRIIKKAAGIIHISESTKKDLEASLLRGISVPSKVIPLGVDVRFNTQRRSEEDSARFTENSPYILFVGTIQYRKNLTRLVEAFAKLKETRNISHKLLLAGRDGWGADQVYEQVRQLKLENDVVFTGYVSDDDLPSLYSEADVFAYPSLHEGFGIPILEAMASGTIVVTSNLYSMPEVGGDAAIYIDPRNVDDISHGLWRAISDHELKERLISQGRERVKLFSWQKTGLATLKFYQELSSNLGLQ